MKREEAIKLLKQYQGYDPMFPDGETLKHAFDLTDETVDTLLTALRPVSREQVEKIRGEWIDIDGETVPVDKYGQTLGWAECSACGQYLTASDEYPCTGHFCPNCGAPMTDEAVQMVMERLEELHDTSN